MTGRRATSGSVLLLSAAVAACLLSAASAPAQEKKVEMSITPEARAAIDRGLASLARTQRPDGSWPSEFGRTTGVVGSCALAFMADGNLPGRGKYGANVERAIAFLMRNARADGLLYQEGMSGTPMYHHGIATLALAEAWGMNDQQDERIRDVLSRAVQLIVEIQNRRGGWRYQPVVADDDMSVTVVQMLALRAARDIGVFVPKETIDLGLSYVRAAYYQQNGTFGYHHGAGGGLATTGAGVLSLQLAGEYQDPKVTEGLKAVLRMFFGSKGEVDHYYYYGRYYLAQAVYQAQSKLEWGITAWNTFYPALVRELVAKQMSTGGWHSLYDEYGTAQAVLMLAIPNRFLPIYQR